MIELDSKTVEYLAGNLLVAMPGMPDPRFSRTVIYLCAHSRDGAMGLVVNKPIDDFSFPDFLAQLKIPPAAGGGESIHVMSGGPMEAGRGFVLHSADYVQEATMPVDGSIALTATIDILHAIAEGNGPRRRMLALGYAGWGPGQLDTEILANGWLHVSCDDNLLFGVSPQDRWQRAMDKIGIDPRMLSTDAGHA